MFNAPERVEVPKKPTPTPYTKKRERTKTTRKDIASEKSKAPRKSKNVV
jgi:hypothetical protein